MFRLHENRFTGVEDTLVKSFIDKYKDYELDFGDNSDTGAFYEQVRVPEIGRISDLVIICQHRIVNIEFKLGDWKCLLSQSIDHLKWCDYSYVCVPINCLRMYPQVFCEELLKNGIGLIVGSNDTFIEVFRARHNTFKNGKDKSLRSKVFSRIGEPNLFTDATIAHQRATVGAPS